MPDVIPFAQALARTTGADRSLLIGNGFSIQHFNYRNLLEKAGLQNDSPVRRLFQVLDTLDFESVICALEDAALVAQAYANDKHVLAFKADANRLREALVRAVRETHPAHREDIAEQIPACIRFLSRFSRLFTLNYDLLLYWVQLAGPAAFKDGFGLGDERNGFFGPFREEAHCNIYNLHGGLHLFQTPEGEIEKRLMGATGIIDAIAHTIANDKRLPLYVAEGNFERKLSKINSVPYLRHSYEVLGASRGSFFVYGHSAAQNDSHIYAALFRSKIDHLYFCIHQPTANLNQVDSELARFKRLHNSKIEYTFVDSVSAAVWG